jgi:hypothetical protein
VLVRHRPGDRDPDPVVRYSPTRKAGCWMSVGQVAGLFIPKLRSSPAPRGPALGLSTRKPWQIPSLRSSLTPERRCWLPPPRPARRRCRNCDSHRPRRSRCRDDDLAEGGGPGVVAILTDSGGPVPPAMSVRYRGTVRPALRSPPTRKAGAGLEQVVELGPVGVVILTGPEGRCWSAGREVPYWTQKLRSSSTPPGRCYLVDSLPRGTIVRVVALSAVAGPA